MSSQYVYSFGFSENHSQLSSWFHQAPLPHCLLRCSPYFGSRPNAGSPFCFNLNHLTIVISSDFISINWTPQRNESQGFFLYKLFTEITHTFHDEQTLRSFSRTINFDCQLCNPILMNMFSFVIWLIFSLSLLCVFSVNLFSLQVLHFGVWSIHNGICAQKVVDNRQLILNQINCYLIRIYGRCTLINTR